MSIGRRAFNAGLAASLAGPALGITNPAQAAYRGPNVIIIRFGGGVRRAEAIGPDASFAPYLSKVLAPAGVLIPDLTIAQLDGVETSHEEGTLNILTGSYRAYRDVESKLFEPHLEPTKPTLFEYLRQSFGVPGHQALLINGEDRLQEEFFSYGVHKTHGIAYRSEVLSLYRFKLWRLRKGIAEGRGTDEELTVLRDELAQLMARDYRTGGAEQTGPVAALWQRWHERYGDSGLKNPRGDAALTELALWAIKHLAPRLMMINYQDPDYVHWGNATHYTRAITRIDEGIRDLVAATAAHEAYRGRTIFVVVPDCGRDANPLLSLPFQHHFNTRSAHEIWAVIAGPGVVKGRVLDKPVDQTSIAPTVAALMGLRASAAEGDALADIIT